MKHALWLPMGLLMFGCGDSTDSATSTSTPESAMEEERAPLRTEPSGSYEEALSSAVAAITIATENGYAWSTSTQLLKDAKSAATAGDEAAAISLADEARMHAELAAIQAAEEARSWRDAVIAD